MVIVDCTSIAVFDMILNKLCDLLYPIQIYNSQIFPTVTSHSTPHQPTNNPGSKSLKCCYSMTRRRNSKRSMGSRPRVLLWYQNLAGKPRTVHAWGGESHRSPTSLRLKEALTALDATAVRCPGWYFSVDFVPRIWKLLEGLKTRFCFTEH